MSEPEILVEHREVLTYLLAEAAEIEHGLMCCYLYAAHSIGAPAQRDQPPERAALLRTWSRDILAVARDEMLHLALVANLTNAIGASPHLLRPNFPVPAGYHPAGVVVSLAPFSLATMEHFVFLERPEGIELADGEGFAPARSYARSLGRGRLVPSAQDYHTVGHLYRGIRSGIDALADRLGEQVLFCGDPALQAGDTRIVMGGLRPVLDVESAHAAIDAILAQGEGTATATEDSHYCRFSRIRDGLRELLRDDPSFDPARGVARNPVMRRPPTPEQLVWIDAEPAASVLDVGNALYMVMLRALDMLFSPLAASAAVGELAADTAFTAMAAIGTVGELLTELPASAAHPGVRAGLSYTMTRTVRDQPDPRGALRTIAELARGIGEGLARHVVPLLASSSSLAERFAVLGDGFASAAEAALAAPRASMPSLPSLPSPPSLPSLPIIAAPTAPPPAASVPTAVDEAQGEKLLLRFETKRCIHSRHCVLGAPRVFLANTPGKWLFPDAIPVESLVAIAHDCPSGAITYARSDGGPEEQAPEVNVLRVREHGPYAVHADLRLGDQVIRRATLCRCGASQNKPFCDGSHNGIAFAATGEPATQASEPLAVRGGALVVTPKADGPLAMLGPLEICSGTGRTVVRLEGTRLCRCGGSSRKPFCDGTHAKIGFRAPGS
jgi:CDGSH-type Zn-finger protein/uncharacterized Fe-S cluster protein YjdI